ncbi:MAG: CocE/NonD family hydrolase [Bryobacteraceae bacterium]|nr:CocE/NonD family hydrolase [Bryobacteraceae bacterium]
MSRVRRLLRAVLRWVLIPILLLAILLAGFRVFFPEAAKAAAGYCATQLLIRGLALRAGTGWAGEGLRVQTGEMVAMRDGVRLATDLYHPSTAGPHPAIIVRTPYNKDEGKLIGEFFARYGYVVAVQDTRGRHKSEGDFYPFRHEAQDGVDFTAWVRRQPWSNGKIGAFGVSYLGFTQWAMAAGNPHLASIAPTFITGDLYEGMYKGGAFAQLTFLEWSLNSYGRYGDWNGAKNIKRGFGHLPLIDSDNAALRDIDFYNDWISHPQPDDYWDPMSPGRRVEQINIPAFLTAGWYDFLLDGQMRDFERIRAHAPAGVRAASKILIGPWSHSFFNNNLKNYGIEQRAMEAIPFEFVKASKDWLDYTLKGQSNGWDRRPAVRAYVLGANTWRDEDQWPPRDAIDRSFYLHSGGNARTLHGDGQLTEGAASATEPGDTFVFDPSNPVPTKGGGHGNAWTAGPVDQRDVEGRQDVLVYTSDAMNEPLLVMGQVRARIFASSTARDTDFTAKLVDVFPDGRALIVCEGILRARYRNGVDKPALLEPGQVYPFNIELGPTAVSFQPGHRIRLEISSSNSPRYDVNPNTGGEIATETARIAATQRVLHNPDEPSALILPVVHRNSGGAK